MRFVWLMRTSVIISREMESVFRMGHHITLLYKGQIEESLPREQFARSENEHVREILTASGVNIPGMEIPITWP